MRANEINFHSLCVYVSVCNLCVFNLCARVLYLKAVCACTLFLSCVSSLLKQHTNKSDAAAAARHPLCALRDTELDADALSAWTDFQLGDRMNERTKEGKGEKKVLL